MQAILTRAATLEAQRQAARDRGDLAARDAAERELAALWRQYMDLERRAGAA
jgi:hypothetical protein